MEKQVSTSASMRYLYEAMMTAKNIWLDNARKNVEDARQLGLCDKETMTFPYLDLRDEVDVNYIVQFDEVRYRYTMLEFHVREDNGFGYEGEWMDEQDFPNDEWMGLIKYIMWKN